jgi:high-affinity nickel-transport protein
VAEASLLAMIALGLMLGLRHGVDWDHIAAIADITGSALPDREATRAASGGVGRSGVAAQGRLAPGKVSAWWQESRGRFSLATLYALGHGTAVMALGLAAIWAGSMLPAWLDPIMERVVGLTLVLLGVWIFYSLWRDGASFRLRSRWMVLLSLGNRAWTAILRRATRHPVHRHARELEHYTPGAAFAVGMIHGVGAETGSQALLLASAAGATTALAGSLMLVFFVGGLILSNSLVAILSTVTFVSSHARRQVFVAIGVAAGVFSLVVGTFFLTGQSAGLPDLREAVDFVFGPITGANGA